jgi:hypothetical protein
VLHFCDDVPSSSRVSGANHVPSREIASVPPLSFTLNLLSLLLSQRELCSVFILVIFFSECGVASVLSIPLCTSTCGPRYLDRLLDQRNSPQPEHQRAFVFPHGHLQYQRHFHMSYRVKCNLATTGLLLCRMLGVKAFVLSLPSILHFLPLKSQNRKANASGLLRYCVA